MSEVSLQESKGLPELVQVPGTPDSASVGPETQETNYGTCPLPDDVATSTQLNVPYNGPALGSHIQRPPSQHGDIHEGFMWATAHIQKGPCAKLPVQNLTPHNERELSPPSTQVPGTSPEILRNGLPMPFPGVKKPQQVQVLHTGTALPKHLASTHQVTPAVENANDKVESSGQGSSKDQRPRSMGSSSPQATPGFTAVEMQPAKASSSCSSQPANSPKVSSPAQLVQISTTNVPSIEPVPQTFFPGEVSQSTSQHVQRYMYEQNALQQKSLAEAFASIEAKNAENNELFEQLQILGQEYTKLQTESQNKDASITTHQQVAKKHEEHIQKLRDYVNGLSKDYNHLKGRMRELAEEHHGLKSGALADAARAHELANSYGEQVENLRGIMQSLQKEQDERLVVPCTPPPDHDKLEQLFVEKYSEMRREYTDRCLEMDAKLDALLKKSESSITPEAPEQPNIVPLLKDCLSRIDQLSERQHVGPHDLQNLTGAMHHYAQSVHDSLHAYERQSSAVVQEQNQLTNAVQSDLHTILNNISSGNTMQEQVAEYREAKATANEELRGAKLQLIEARCEASSLRERQAEHAQTMHRLQAELEVARQHPRDAPEILLRISELQSTNQELQTQRTMVEGQVSSMTEQVKAKEREVDKVHGEMSGLQMQLEQAMAQAARAHTESKDHESRLEDHRKAADEHANKAAKLTLANWEKNAENDRKRLQSELDQAKEETKILSAKQQTEAAPIDNSAEVETLKEKILALESAQSEELNQLRSQLEERSVQNKGLQARVEELQKLRHGVTSPRRFVEDSQPRSVPPMNTHDVVGSPGEFARSEMDSGDWFQQQHAMKQLQLGNETSSTRKLSYTEIVTTTPRKRRVVEDSQDKAGPREDSQGPMVPLPSALRTSRPFSGSQESVRSDRGSMRPPVAKKVKLETESQTSSKSVSFAGAPPGGRKAVSNRKPSVTTKKKENKMSATFAQFARENLGTQVT